MDKIYTNLHWDVFAGIVNKIDWAQNIKTSKSLTCQEGQTKIVRYISLLIVQLN